MPLAEDEVTEPDGAVAAVVKEAETSDIDLTEVVEVKTEDKSEAELSCDVVFGTFE